jgi:hypothetical protein
MFRLDKTAIKKVKLGQEDSPFVYWQTQPFEKRISAIEFLRKQINGTQSRLQRVYRVIKQA